MPHDQPERQDPHGRVLSSGDAETMREMAETLSDAFARIGYTAPRILALFLNPFFSGHDALLALGEPAIRRIIVKRVLKWPAGRPAASAA
jgi:hypothetical protein